MQDLSCECRITLQENIRQSFEWRAASLERAESQLVGLIQGEYVAKLILDLRIFAGTNAVVFLVSFGISLLKAQAVAQLFLPGALLLIATLVSGYFYIFNQTWFFTIIYNDYVGYGYIVYVFLVFLFLCDVVFNKARVTTEIINQLLSAIGRVASLPPC